MEPIINESNRRAWVANLCALRRDHVEAALVLGLQPLNFVDKLLPHNPQLEDDALALLSPIGKPKLRKGTPASARREWARRLSLFRKRLTANHEGIEWFLSEELDMWRLSPCGTEASR